MVEMRLITCFAGLTGLLESSEVLRFLSPLVGNVACFQEELRLLQEHQGRNTKTCSVSHKQVREAFLERI